jgi:N utilization substance protein B
MIEEFFIMSSREYNVRDSVFKLLFEKNFRDDSLDELFDIVEQENIEEIDVTNKVKSLVRNILEKQSQLDEIVSQFSKTRTVDRIAPVNLIILRIAIYEILFDSKVPTNTAIHEAVKLAQTYSDPSDVKFVNGLLGAYARSLKDSE